MQFEGLLFDVSGGMEGRIWKLAFLMRGDGHHGIIVTFLHTTATHSESGINVGK